MAVFDENTDLLDVTVDSLVGEGKKFKTVDDLAKGKAESDRVIAAREQELSELRTELSKRESIEQAIQRLTKPPIQSAEPVLEPKPAANTPSFTDEDLVARIREVTKQESEQEQIKANVKSVANRLIEVYGSEAKANEVVNQKAQELGLSVDFLQSVAAKSPNAFFVTVGLEVTPQATPAVSHGDVNPQALANARPGIKPGSYEYFEEIRKTNPAQYFKPATQNALMKAAFAAAAKGETFGRA